MAIYSIIYDGQEIGTVITSYTDTSVIAEEWIKRMPNAVNGGIRRAIRENHSLITVVPWKA